MIERAGHRIRVRVNADLHVTEATAVAEVLTALVTEIRAEVGDVDTEPVTADALEALEGLDLDEPRRREIAGRIARHLALAGYRRPRPSREPQQPAPEPEPEPEPVATEPTSPTPGRDRASP